MESSIHDAAGWLGHFSWDVIGGTPKAGQLRLGRHRWDIKGGTTKVFHHGSLVREVSFMYLVDVFCLEHYSWDVIGGTPEAGQQWLGRHRRDTRGGTTEVVHHRCLVHEVSFSSLVDAFGGCGSSLEFRVSAVLFFPTPRFSHWVFTWKGFLRRQAHLVHQSPSKRWADVYGLSCALMWYFPVGVLVIVFIYICNA